MDDPDVLYEAAAIQDARVLDSDEARVFGGKSFKTKKGRIKVVNIDIGGGVDADGFQLAADPKQLKKKIRRTIIQELSNKDVMSDDRAKTVSCLIMKLFIKCKLLFNLSNKQNLLALFLFPFASYNHGRRVYLTSFETTVESTTPAH